MTQQEGISRWVRSYSFRAEVTSSFTGPFERLSGSCAITLLTARRLMGKVKLDARHISTEKAHFDEARVNLAIRHAVDPATRRWYWALPGDEFKVPNVTRYFHSLRKPPVVKRKKKPVASFTRTHLRLGPRLSLR
jgi:hypothetical protein